MLCAAEVLAAPPIRELTIEGANDAGQVLFPIVEPDGGASARLTLRFNSTGASSLDALSVINDTGTVFDVVGVAPANLGSTGSSTITVNFKPRDQLGSFAGRLVIDWDGTERDDGIVLCGTSSLSPDGGVASACSAVRAPERQVFTNQQRGCSTGAGSAVLLALLAWGLRRQLSASRAHAGTDRSPR
jgi:hypothetical protein